MVFRCGSFDKVISKKWRECPMKSLNNAVKTAALARMSPGLLDEKSPHALHDWSHDLVRDRNTRARHSGADA
jgi:hypothetical protein